MINYVNKCATCKSFKKIKGIRTGKCTNKNSRCYDEINGFVNMAKWKCICYSFNAEVLCKCGAYKEEDYKYCPKCGKKIDD